MPECIRRSASGESRSKKDESFLPGRELRSGIHALPFQKGEALIRMDERRSEGESLARGFRPQARFVSLWTAKLVSALLPGLARDASYRLRPDPEEHGFALESREAWGMASGRLGKLSDGRGSHPRRSGDIQEGREPAAGRERSAGRGGL
jgi:hypothetical protein